MFQSSGKQDLSSRTVGVVSRDDAKVFDGHVLFSAGRNTFLIDTDGRVVHEWVADRNVFAAELLPTGNLVRDGHEDIDGKFWNAGGAAGYIEEVTWENERVWYYQALPSYQSLTHHSVSVLPSGNVLICVWERLAKEEALALGRRPELLPDGELWKEKVVELEPDRDTGHVKIAWEWDIADHLIQDYNPKLGNYGKIEEHPEKFDVNSCPMLGKAGQRNTFDPESNKFEPPKTGEKDWIHMNCASFDPLHNHIIISANVHSEVLVIDRNCTTEEARGPKGDFLYRWGNPQNYRLGTKTDQRFFNQHSASIVQSGRGKGNLIVFNNGRVPDRAYSTVDEVQLPRDGNGFVRQAGKAFGPEDVTWTFGPKAYQLGSFYCTHISGVQRLANDNTLICMGTLGVICEIDAQGNEVWRYVSPALLVEGAHVAFVRQGQYPLPNARRSLFMARKYASDFEAFSGRDLTPKRFLEA